ncbi:hypothetical protein HDV05_005499 [Chytridiales sp. JEL 0842]|nr:hypothetical protein HDV05_005499 [Chytridiales sp. JEL 0842]
MDGIKPEDLKRGSQLWNHLDDLAANDKEAYNKFIKSVLSSAPQKRASNTSTTTTFTATQTLVEPGFAIIAKLQSPEPLTKTQTIAINIAQSTNFTAPPPNDPLNIPICLSKLRYGTDTDNNQDEHVVLDAVVHQSVISKCKTNSIFRKSLIDLVIDCILETENLIVIKSDSYQIIDRKYFGPYGWDQIGQPLGTLEKQASSSQEAKTAPRKPLIQVIGKQDETDATVNDLVADETADDTEIVVPLYKIITNADTSVAIIVVELPLITKYV